EHVLDRLVGERCAIERLVGVIHVRLVVLVVVDAHRLLVDVRLERVVVVRKRGKLECHVRSFLRCHGEATAFGVGRCWLCSAVPLVERSPLWPRWPSTTRRSPPAS